MRQTLNRRGFVRASALTALGAVVAACAQPTPQVIEKEVPVEKVVKETVVVEKEVPVEKAVKETVVVEKEKVVEKVVTATPEPAKYKEAPMLAELVKAGKLPPVEQRIPSEPMVIKPFEKIGKYGGEWRLGTLGPADGAIFTRYAEYENLVRWDPPWTQVIPGVVKSWEIQENGKVFVFNLRKGMKWSDGEPFTADDIYFWYELASNKELNPAFPSTWSTVGDPVVVTKVDDYTVKFAFTHPYGLFLRRLACPGGELFSPKHYGKQYYPAYADKAALDAKVKEAGVDKWNLAWGGWMNARTVPAVPTIFAWKYQSKLGEGATFVAERNPYYWKVDTEGQQLPYVDRQVYVLQSNTEAISLMAAAGEIAFQDRHVATAMNKALFLNNLEKSNTRFIECSSSGNCYMTIALNWCHKDPVMRQIIQTKDFRVALSIAINRQEIIDVILLGQGYPWQPAPLRGSSLYNERLATQYLEYDPVKANQMLDQILPKKDAEGYRLRPDGKPLGIIVETQMSQEWIDILEMVKTYWKAVGVRMQVKAEDRSLFYERKLANEHDAGVWGSNGGAEDVILGPRWWFPETNESVYATPWALWWQTKGQEGEEPPEIVKKQQALYDQLLITPDAAGQNKLMAEILEIAADQFYTIGISGQPLGYGLAKKNFRNIIEPYWSSWLYPNPGPMDPCTFFWDS